MAKALDNIHFNFITFTKYFNLVICNLNKCYFKCTNIN